MAEHRRRVAIAEKVRDLIDSSFATRYHDLEATLKSASLAVVLAEEERHELPVDLVVAAWTEYGNALRIAGRYGDAERALEHAAAQPAVDLPTRNRVLEVTASLHRNTGRYESAASFLSTAIDLQRSIPNPDGEARLHNLLGIVYRDWGKYSDAFDAFRNAMALFGPSTPPDVVVSTGHNLFETFIDTGQLEEASAALVVLDPYYRSLTSARIAAKAEWMRARLCRAMHQFPAAQLAYERAYDILSQEPRSPELSELANEMSDLALFCKPKS